MRVGDTAGGGGDAVTPESAGDTHETVGLGFFGADAYRLVIGTALVLGTDADLAGGAGDKIVVLQAHVRRLQALAGTPTTCSVA
jgi:hypothetical protein